MKSSSPPVGSSVNTVCLAAVLLLLALLAASASADLVDNYVRAELEKQRSPGASLLVMQGGKIVKAAGYGLADLERQVPVKPETIFQSGSVGKQFTALAVMMLVEDGKLALDERVRKYLPEAPATWEDITLRHLLSHTSGIEDYEETTDLNLRLDFTDDELLKFAFGCKQEFAPGTRWAYSNTGYLLLGIIIKRVSGEFYGDLLQRRVFAPLGMGTARVIGSDADLVPNRAAGYRLLEGKIANQEWVSPTFNRTADGTLYFSVLDFAKWAEAVRTHALVSEQSWQAMTSAVQLKSGATYPYGFGWALAEWGGQAILAHDGAWQGFSAYFARRLGADELAVAVFTNRDGASPGRIARGVMALYEPVLAPSITPMEDREPEVTRKVQDLLVRAAAKKVDATEFAYLRGGFNGQFVDALAGSVASLGELKALRLLSRRELGDDREYRYEGQFSAAMADVTVQFTAEGKVAVVRVRPR